MGIFWKYFQKLSFPLILKGGALAKSAMGGAEALDTARDNIFWLRNQFLPEICDAQYLSDFSRSRGIVRAPVESSEQFTRRVIYAWQFFRLGGKAAGLPEILKLYGILDVELVEHLQLIEDFRKSGGEFLDGGGVLDGIGDLSSDLQIRFVTSGWAEFVVRFNTGGDVFNINTQRLIVHIINDIKPARSRLAGLEFFVGLSFDSQIYFSSFFAKIQIKYQNCRRFVVPSFDVIGYACEDIGGWNDPDYIDGVGRIDGWGIIDGYRPEGDLLDGGWGNLHSTVKTRQSVYAGGDKAENDTLALNCEYKIEYIDGTGDLSVITLDGSSVLNGIGDLSIEILTPEICETLDGVGNLGVVSGRDGIWCSGKAVYRQGNYYYSEAI